MIYSLYQHSHSNIDWVMSPYLFPLLISIFLLFLSAGLAAETFRNGGETKRVKEEKVESGGTQRVPFFLTVAGMVVYYLIMPYIGFIFSSLLFLAAMFWLLGERRWQIILLLSVGTTLALYGVFHELLHVMLP